MKKCFIFLALIPFIIAGHALAYDGGLLDGKPLFWGKGWTVYGTTAELTDNNPDTYFRIPTSGGKVWYEFEEDKTIDGIFIIPETGVYPYVIFYDSSRNEINRYQNLKRGYNKIPEVHGVRIVSILNITEDGKVMHEFDVFEVIDHEPPAEVTGLQAKAGDGEVTLSYQIPKDADFSHVNIYQDGTRIAERVTMTSYVVSGLQNGRTYTFRVTAVDKAGNESAGVTVQATPMEESREVQNLKVTAKHDRVNLSWTNPKKDFSHVNIYRKTIEKTSFSIFQTAYAAEGYDPLFETNGTFFNDLTVQPETTYEYLLTTENSQGVESPGVTVQVTTLAVPPPSLGGTEIVKDENGDITVRWTPQPGQMIIEIDGREYTRVDAMLGQYTIPAADIPYDQWGNPARIRLIPVAPNGDTGTPVVINPGGWLISLPFGGMEVIRTAVDLMMVLGPILLLALILWYVRPIMNLLKKAANRKTGRVRT